MIKIEFKPSRQAVAGRHENSVPENWVPGEFSTG